MVTNLAPCLVKLGATKTLVVILWDTAEIVKGSGYSDLSDYASGIAVIATAPRHVPEYTKHADRGAIGNDPNLLNADKVEIKNPRELYKLLRDSGCPGGLDTLSCRNH